PSGTGQASDPIRRLTTSQSPVFLVNSRNPLVCAPPQGLPLEKASFFRRYGGNLPSSFSRVLSSALVCSTSPPVSVWSTVLRGGYFQGRPGRQVNPVRPDDFRHPSPPAGSGMFT